MKYILYHIIENSGNSTFMLHFELHGEDRVVCINNRNQAGILSVAREPKDMSAVMFILDEGKYYQHSFYPHDKEIHVYFVDNIEEVYGTMQMCKVLEC